MEDINDADYAHTKRVREYHDLYLQSNTLLLADVFENFKIMSVKIYELDPAKFLSAPGLAWQTALKKTKVKLDLLTDINMFLTLFRMGWGWGQKGPPTSFSPVTSTNVGVSPQNVLNYFFNSFVTLV